MKKYLSIFFLLLVFVSASLAMAESDKDTITLDTMGVTATLPEVYPREAGFAFLLEKGVESRKPYVATLCLEYFPLPMETYHELENSIDSMSEEEKQMVRDLFSVPAEFFVTDGTFEDIKPYLESEATSDPVQIGSSEGYTYWFVTTVSDKYLQFFEDEDVETLKEAYEEELQGIRDEFLADLKTATFFKPIDEAAEYVGKTISFTSKDLDGNTVTSAELFADNKVTMVNVWGTWCGNCVGEIGELAEIHKRLQKKGCGIVGIEHEYDLDEQTLNEAREILSSNGVTYPNVLEPENDPVFGNIQAYPTTFFVDSEGNILTYPITGAAVGEYENAVDKLLNGETVAPVEGNDAAVNEAKAYRVIVYDKDGPVKGAVIQFCDPSSCTLGKTDDQGIATFDMPEGVVYDVHVLKVPAGYQKEMETYHTLDKYSDINIILEKQ